MPRNYAEHKHRNPAPWQGAPAWALEIAETLAILMVQQEANMAALDDLKTADAAIVDLVNKLVAEVQRLDAKISATPAGTPDSELAPVASDLQNAVAAGTAALTASQQAVP